jgi:hypothetical protein
MKTLIFNSYNEFLKRPDKLINGVSQDFANENPKYEAMNETNKACWNCRSCSDCSDCSSCSSCSYCSDCSDCSEIKRVEGTKGDKKVFAFPFVENIHQRVYKAMN